jgi:hypothetical protein
MTSMKKFHKHNLPTHLSCLEDLGFMVPVPTVQGIHCVLESGNSSA